MTVSAILHDKGSDVATATGETTLQDIAELLTAKRIGSIVIVDKKGRVEGIVSERDIVRAVAETGPKVVKKPVKTVMTRDVVTCEEADVPEKLMSIMTERRFRHFPVTRNGILIGIVSIGDIVKSCMEKAVAESEAMRDYIATG